MQQELMFDDVIDVVVIQQPKKTIKINPFIKDKSKALATLGKRYNSVMKKADNISIEVHGNWTNKRAREASNRKSNKEYLEKIGAVLSHLIHMWEDDKMILELSKIRSQTDIEVFNSYWFNEEELIHDHQKENWVITKKKLNRLGISNSKDHTYVHDMIKDMMKVELSDEEIKARELQEKIDSIRGMKISGFFPTPDPLIDLMIDHAELVDGDKILEPGAGIGSIPDRIHELGYSNCQIVCCELVSVLYDILELKGYTVASRSIFDMVRMEAFDKIIMNPPFEKKEDITHVKYCYDNFLVKSGRLVSVMGAGVLHNSDKKTIEFREFVEENGEFVELEDGQFKGAFNHTMVGTCLVILDK